MTGVVIERSRTAWDILWGALVVLAGLVILGHVAIATVVSVLLLGWIALLAGGFAVVGAFFRIGRGGVSGPGVGGGQLRGARPRPPRRPPPRAAGLNPSPGP